MSTTKPAVVIVPGAWHVPAHYRLLTEGLQSTGYEAMTCDMPSVGPPHPLPDMSQDVTVVQEAIRSYITRGLNVVLVMHSIGGVIGTAACEGLSAQDQSSGNGIISLVYIASLPVPAGGSLFNASQGNKHASWITVTGQPGTGVFMQPGSPGHDAIEIFYNDCTPEAQQAAWKEVEINYSENVCHDIVPYAAWKEIESNYLICEIDNAIPAQAQEVLSSQEGGKWKRVERLHSGHSPFLSKPEETVAFVRRCAGEDI